MSNATIIQCTYADLMKMVATVSRPAARWQLSAKFAREHNMTHRQMETMRANNPTWFKLNSSGTRWLIDTKAYNNQ